jgi:GxxExxY protein
MPNTELPINVLTSRVIAAAIEVHSELGPGLLESIYERCMVQELRDRNLNVDCQVAVPVRYKGKDLGTMMRLDLLVEGRLVVEVKAVEFVHAAHRAQLLTYLKLTGCTLGLIINFNEALVKDGIHRVINGYFEK